MPKANGKSPAKRVLYFADLNHITPGKQWTIIPFPLSVASIAAFTEKMLPGEFEIRIFKDPHKFLDAINRQAPDLVAFSNYIWNRNLQLEFAKHLKSLHPACVTVMGGPNYNFSEPDWIEGFARSFPQIDFHIEGEGEVRFFNTAACLLAHGFDLEKTKAANPAGAAFLKNDRLVMNPLRVQAELWHRLDGLNLETGGNRLRDLGDIPSPYLTGLLDDFLADPNFCPIIETNRGCPYSCTFCNWGDMGKSKSAMFPLDRIIEEIKFIVEKNVSRTPYLYIGDANFGLFPRDLEIAKLLREMKDTRKYPQNLYLYFAKNSSEKVVRIAEILKDMVHISLSRQSQNEEVLQNIKRSNISIDTFNSLAALAKSLGVDSKVELIYSLPGESKESFYAGVRQIMAQNVDGLHMFPAMLLDGSEMGTRASRERYGIKGEWRQIDGCAGVYGPVTAIEYEEIVTSTAVMSREDYLEIRLFHFLQALFLDTKIYKDVEVLLGSLTCFDLIQDIISNRDKAPAPFRLLLEDFLARSGGEFLQERPSRFTPEMVASAAAKSVKLNPLFIAKLLHDPEVRPAFNSFLGERIAALGRAGQAEIRGVLAFINAMIYPFDGSETREVEMAFDAVAFAKRPPFERAGAAAYLLNKPAVFRYRKPFTYHNFIEAMETGMPHAEKVYNVVLHHTHEKLRQTLIWRLQGPAAQTAEGREIRMEGGWLY